MGNKIWICAGNTLEKRVSELMAKFSLPRPIALFLANRDVDMDNVELFMNPVLGKLSDPYRFPGIKDAVARLWDAIRNDEPILIHGDYDTDGITATALLSSVLRHNGAKVTSFIPHRFDDGYGFTPESLDKALKGMERKCGVLVTVDCGITSIDAVEYAKKLGIDVIITDHHEPINELPNALAIVNPKVYPELHDLDLLAGAGVAFKLSHAFVKWGREQKLGGFNTKLQEVLDYVALGTIADIVPILGENRILVKYGLEILKKQLRPGIRALIESARASQKLRTSDITFKLAPRLNASGRLGDAYASLALLESDNIVEAYKYAAKLDDYNHQRQELEQEIYTQAKSIIENEMDMTDASSIVVAGENWHQGVIGIVASRLARDYNRPAIVLTIIDGMAHGSGRSIGSLNLVDVLVKCSDLLERHGGHPMAVGLGLESKNIPAFAKKFEGYTHASLSEHDLCNSTVYDGDVELKELDDHFFTVLDQLSPFGHSNNKPLFRFNNLETVKCTPIAGNKHCRGILRNHHNEQIEFIAFNCKREDISRYPMDILATPQLNDFYNERRPQLQIIDIIPSC